MCTHTHTHIGLASWVCSLGSCTGPHSWKGSVLELILCCYLHESIYKFLTRGHTFLFCTWPHKLCSWSSIHIRIWTILEWSVQFSHSVVSDSLRLHGLQHARLPCPSPTPGVYSNSCPLSQQCHPTISSSVIPFSSWPQSLPASGSFPISQFFASGGQSIGVSALASVLPMNIQD